jgi:Putative transposase
LGAYVTRTAITDRRIVRVDQHSVTFRWKDRSDGSRTKELTLPGVEFATRYLAHVLPTGLRSVCYYGFCHPTAKAKLLRVQLHSGRDVDFGRTNNTLIVNPAHSSCPPCPRCGRETQLLFRLLPCHPERGPPMTPQPKHPAVCLAA